MSTNTKLAFLQKAETQISEQIEESKFYEALRLIVTVSNRYVSMKLFDKALQCVIKGSQALLQKGEFNVGGEAAQHYLSLLKKQGVPPSSEYCDHIKDIFQVFPSTKTPSDSPMNLAKVTFMKTAITWVHTAYVKCEESQYSQRSEILSLEQSLHQKLAAFAFSIKDYALGNIHYAKANQPTIHSVVVHQQVMPLLADTEKDLCLLRLVLYYLCADNLEGARKFLHASLVKFKSSPSILDSPYVHCAQNLVQVCRVGNVKLFKTFEKIYSTILTKDSELPTYLTKTGQMYCGLPKSQSFLDSIFA